MLITAGSLLIFDSLIGPGRFTTYSLAPPIEHSLPLDLVPSVHSGCDKFEECPPTAL